MCTDESLVFRVGSKKTVHRKCSKSTDYAYAKMIQSNRISHKYIHSSNYFDFDLRFAHWTEPKHTFYSSTKHTKWSVQISFGRTNTDTRSRAVSHAYTHMKLRPICMHDTGHMCDFSLSMKRVSFVTRARACTCVWSSMSVYDCVLCDVVSMCLCHSI